MSFILSFMTRTHLSAKKRFYEEIKIIFNKSSQLNAITRLWNNAKINLFQPDYDYCDSSNIFNFVHFLRIIVPATSKCSGSFALYGWYDWVQEIFLNHAKVNVSLSDETCNKWNVTSK